MPVPLICFAVALLRYFGAALALGIHYHVSNPRHMEEAYYSLAFVSLNPHTSELFFIEGGQSCGHKVAVIYLILIPF